jgi:putative ABC transport system permease protein
VFAFVDLGGQRIPTNLVAALPSTFALYGIAPIAGSLAGLPPRGEERVSRIVINEAAVHRFGFGTPEAAIGKIVPVPPFAKGTDQRAAIVAVVPDFQFTSVETAAKPTIYVAAPHAPGSDGLVSIRLDGRQLPETLAAIDKTWLATGGQKPIERRFLQDRIEELYRDLERSTQLFAGFALLAVLLAGAGMVGIAIATTDRRTKEIGIRKAMGASTSQVLVLLLRQLTRPALIANFIAWPATWFIMQRWLEGYAYRIDMPFWLFPAAGAAAFVIAVVSITAQATAAARRPPIATLRYE